jgi:hypothetical protein
LKVFRRCTFSLFSFSKENKTYGDFILWTPLQFACCIGKQKSVDFLIQNGADPLIKDSTGRKAQDIADLRKNGCKVTIKPKVIIPNVNLKNTNDAFPEFVKDPMNFLCKMDGKMDEIKEFKTHFENHFKGNPNQHLNGILMEKIKSGNFKDLFSDTFFRENCKVKFFKIVIDQRGSWPLEVKKLYNRLDEKFEEEKKLAGKELQSFVLEKMFFDWVNETSPVMKQLDKMINFKQVNENIKTIMIKKVLEVKKPENLFPEIEKAFKTAKTFQSMKYDTEFELFSQMNSKVEKLTLENQELKLENEKKDLEIEQLKSIIHHMENINPEIPHDAVFISDDQ